MGWREQCDIRIRLNRRILKWPEWHEGIVLRGQNQSGAPDGSDYIRRARTRIILSRVLETAEARGYNIVEIPHGSDAPKGCKIERENFGKQAGFVTHMFLKTFHKMAVVEEISRLGESVGASGQIKSGSDSHECPQLRRRGFSEFSGHLQNQIAAHGKAGGEDFRQAIAVD